MMNRKPRHIAFVSPAGGTGQTTVVANLASLWSASGRPCLAVDLCAQNSLGLHLGQTRAEASGWTAASEAGQWWAEPTLENSQQVRFLPHGTTTSPAHLATLTQTLAQDPHWLATQLQAADLEDNCLVLLDAPIWPQTLASQALACADLVVVCLDASPRAPLLRPQLQALRSQLKPGAALALVATRFNPRRDSQCQALETLRAQWADHLAPHVLHEDESVSAALAVDHCVVAHAPHAQAAHDLQGIARWLLAQCGQTAYSPL
jgi:cellulose synthase operon protein YhjQ